MGVGERVGHFTGDVERLLDREFGLLPEASAQALALDVGHRVPQLSIGLSGVEDGQDMGVLEPGGRADLAEEALRGPLRGRARGAGP